MVGPLASPNPFLDRCRRVYDGFYDRKLDTLKENRPFDPAEAWSAATRAQGFKDRADFMRICREKLDPRELAETSREAAIRYTRLLREWKVNEGK